MPPRRTAPSGGDAALKQRVEQLEEQLVDMQVVVGTLELLARNGAASAPRKDGDSGGDGADSMRVDALETQVRAMAAQIEQLSQQVRALGGQPKRTEATPDALPPDTPLAKPGPGDAARFGSTTVTAGTGDAVADVSDSEQPAAPPAQRPPLAQKTPGEHAQARSLRVRSFLRASCRPPARRRIRLQLSLPRAHPRATPSSFTRRPTATSCSAITGGADGVRGLP